MHFSWLEFESKPASVMENGGNLAPCSLPHKKGHINLF